MWPDRRLIDLFRIELPFVQAPMAGAMDHELAAAAAEAGALGVLPCAMLSEAQVREQAARFRASDREAARPRVLLSRGPGAEQRTRSTMARPLAPYYRELAIDPAAPVPSSNRNAFDARMCEVVEEIKPEVASFHFGLPSDDLVRRVKAVGCVDHQFGDDRRGGALAGRSRLPMPSSRKAAKPAVIAACS